MRRFTDRSGRLWDVVPGRESWGSLVLLFVPVGARRPIMQAPLGVTRSASAEVELEGMAEAQLQDLLDRSTEKEE